MDDSSFYPLLIAIVLGLICSESIPACYSHQRKVDELEKKAVQKGYGEYIHQNGNLEFQWKEKTN